MNDIFNLQIDGLISDEIYKSTINKKGRNKYDNMLIEGIASTNDEDLQGETLEPSGFIINDFIKSGLINLEHYTTRKGDPLYWIGQPIEAKILPEGLYVKAKLWKGHKIAENLWDTLLVMKENNVDRKLGWSIEGQALERDINNEKHILKAKIKHCAVTFNPVNINSYANITKSESINNNFIENINGGEYILRFEKNGNIITINNDFSVDVTQKSMTTENIRPLIKEELDKKNYNNVNWDIISKSIKKDKINNNYYKIVKNYINI